MTTSQFIKMLQDADPSGIAHIRMSGGVPKYAELKPGYWDGPYQYIDDDGNWVYSSMNNKVDIWTEEIEDYIGEMLDTYNTPPWDEIKKKFKFELTSSPELNKEREDKILKEAKSAYDDLVEIYKRFREEGEARAIKNANDGWTWFQNKLVDDNTIESNQHHYYTWKIYDKPTLMGLIKKEQSSNSHNVEAVYKSGLFERVDNNKMPGYYEWIKK
nr:hypothetical protein [uncultured archaeon]